MAQKTTVHTFFSVIFEEDTHEGIRYLRDDLDYKEAKVFFDQAPYDNCDCDFSRQLSNSFPYSIIFKKIQSKSVLSKKSSCLYRSCSTGQALIHGSAEFEDDQDRQYALLYQNGVYALARR